MLPQKNRLKDFAVFQEVARKGKKQFSAHFRISTLRNQSTLPRVGFVVSKKVAKKATERNLLKRRMREAVRRDLLSRLPHTDIVISALPGSTKLSYNEIIGELRKIIENV